MKFSLVIPTYNQEGLLPDTLASVMAQNFEDLEVIVVDGGCSLQNIKTVERFSSLNIRLVSERDGGQSEAINKGFRLATGDLLGWLNSDDLLMPGALQYVSDLLQKSPEFDVATGGAIIFDEGQGSARMHVPPEFDKTRLTYDDFLVQPATFWRRRVWDEVGPLNESLHFVLDWDWFIRASMQFRFVSVGRCLAMYRLHPGHKTGTRSDDRLGEILQLVRTYADVRIADAMVDVAPIASRLQNSCQLLQRLRLHALRRLLFPRLYWKHGSARVHEVLPALQ